MLWHFFNLRDLEDRVDFLPFAMVENQRERQSQTQERRNSHCTSFFGIW